MQIFILRISTTDGSRFRDTAFVDETVAQLRAEWTSYTPRCAEGERLSNGQCLVDDRVYPLDETTAQEEHCKRGLDKLTTDERVALKVNYEYCRVITLGKEIVDSKIVLAILGHGTCGKTTSARWLASVCGLCYKYSTSEFAKMTIELPGDKFENRVAWGRAIADFNNQDGGIKLYKLMAKDHDIFDGIRRINELEGAGLWISDQRKVFVPIWIDRDVPEDPSCEIRPEHCRFSVNNRNELVDLYSNLDLLWKGMRALR